MPSGSATTSRLYKTDSAAPGTASSRASPTRPRRSGSDELRLFERSPVAGDKLGEGGLGLGASHHVRRVVALVRPLLLEVGAEVAQQERLHTHDRLTAGFRRPCRPPHRLLAQPPPRPPRVATGRGV